MSILTGSTNPITLTATYQTIKGQPLEVKRLLKDENSRTSIAQAAGILAKARKVFLAGTGTSFHAAKVSEFVLRQAGIEAWAVPAYDFSLYPQPLGEQDVVVIFSHRGTKLFSRQAVDKARGVGAKVIVITGHGSPLNGPEYLVLQTTAQEKSSTHTASYTTALTLIIRIAALVAEEKNQPGVASRLQFGLQAVPEAMQEVFNQETALEMAARLIAKAGGRLFIAGNGPGGITAAEGALKLKEAAYITAEGTALETFLHGPIVSLGSGDFLILLNSFEQGPGAERTASIAEAARAIGVQVWLVGQSPESAGLVPLVKIAPPGGEEICAALVEVVVLQLLACFIAGVRQANPDSFRYDVPGYKAAITKISL